MITLEQVAEEIKKLGYRIDSGPFENARYLSAHGVRMVRIRTILTPPQIRQLGLKLKKPDKPGNSRSLRFLVREGEDGLQLTHITSAQRKHRRSDRKKARRRQEALNDSNGSGKSPVPSNNHGGPA